MAGSQQIIRRKFRWIVEGVTREKLEKDKFCKSSSAIEIDLGDNKTEWSALIEVNTFESKKYLRVAIHKCKAIRDDFFLRFNVTLGGSSRLGKKWKAMEIVNVGWSMFIALDTLFDSSQKLLVNGNKLELIYDVSLFYTVGGDAHVEKVEEDSLKSKFFNNGLFWDFVLKSSDGKEFRAHRVFLSDASDVFMNMLTIDMKEKKEGSVAFEDIDSSTLELVLCFIYKGKAQIDDIDKASKAIYAAEKFNLPGLKAICRDMLEKKLCKDTALELLAIADMYDDKVLEEGCLNLIIENYADVKKDELWKLMPARLFTKITDAFETSMKLPIVSTYSKVV